MTTPIVMQSEQNNRGISFLDIVACVWGIGCLSFISVHFISYLRYKNQVVKRGKIIKDTDVLHQMFELRRELHIKSTVRVMESHEAGSPMIIGFVKPVLVLPKEQYSPEELFFILKHELVHLKHNDAYMKLLFVAANAVHWFNPFIWIMHKEAVIDMELSCDERVTQDADYAMRKAYTETLLSTLHKQCAKGSILSTHFYEGKQIMKKRFRNILIKTGKKNGAAILLCAVVLTVGLGTLIGCSVVKENAAENDGQIYGYISGFGNDSVTIDQQIWATVGSEYWKPEYDADAGFEVVDVQSEDITCPILQDCTYFVLENHYNPIIELSKEEFESYLSEMEYPVLWIIELEEGQVKSIMEQYRP